MSHLKYHVMSDVVVTWQKNNIMKRINKDALYCITQQDFACEGAGTKVNSSK